MNIEKQNIVIAVACGWTEIEPCTCCDGVSRGYSPTPGAHKKHLPDYLNSLDAMHEAEAQLTNDQKHRYVTELFELYKTADGERDVTGVKPPIGWYPVHATAVQRAEARLRTMGKWEEDK